MTQTQKRMSPVKIYFSFKIFILPPFGLCLHLDPATQGHCTTAFHLQLRPFWWEQEFTDFSRICRNRLYNSL